MPTSAKAIYFNLPVKDPVAVRNFWTRLGFEFFEPFSDQNTLCMVLEKDRMYAMFVSPDFLADYLGRPVPEPHCSFSTIAVAVESRAKVDEIVALALENGATRFQKAVDNDWMYYDSFLDPEGQHWEFMFSDPSKIPST